jgi:hypothetical protein
MSRMNQGRIGVAFKWRRNKPLVTPLSLQISHHRAKSRDHILTAAPSSRLGASSRLVTAVARVMAKPDASHRRGMHKAAGMIPYSDTATPPLKAKAGTNARSRAAHRWRDLRFYTTILSADKTEVKLFEMSICAAGYL